MTNTISPLAGKPAPASILINVDKLIAAYYDERPDPSIPSQRVIFGTSGHRGSAFKCTFNEWHILAISQAICLYRKQEKITGPLFLGMDTHALSKPALETALEVFAANELEVMLAEKDEFTPTPVISHAILHYNRSHGMILSDGVVMTPSHDPPQDGGFKYNPPTGGPANLAVTAWIEKKANEFLEAKLSGVKRIPFKQALQVATTRRYDYLNTYINDLENVIDMDAIRTTRVRIGVDPLGGAGVHYWPAIRERYGLNMVIMNDIVDPTFKFMTVDWDGQLRMDPSSPYAMASLLKDKEHFDLAFGCDTDHDRHGIISKSRGLIPSNHFLVAAISYLFQKRPMWWDREPIIKPIPIIAKTIVSTQMINRLAASWKRKVVELPVGFKWFVDGLLNTSFKFCGEESAGATFSRLTGEVWTTDKDGILLGLLAAEMQACLHYDVGEVYPSLEKKLGKSFYKRVDAQATFEQKQLLKSISSKEIVSTELAGEQIQAVVTEAPGNGMPIGGVKVNTENGWFVARPSGTEDIYRIYAESFQSGKHLEAVLSEAQTMIQNILGGK